MLIAAKKIPRSLRYLIGLALSLLALLLQIVLALAIGNREPFLLFVPLVALAAAVLGTGPALLVICTGFLYGVTIFLPLHSLAVSNAYDQLSLLVYVVVGVFFLYVGRMVRAVAQRALNAELALLNEKMLHQREKDEHLRRLFQQAPGFMTIMRGAEHVFEFENDAFARLHGHRAVLGKSARAAFPEMMAQGLLAWLDDVYRDGKPHTAYEVPLALQRQAGAAPDQLFVDFVLQPIVDSDGAVSGIFCEGFDVTARKQTEQALRSSEERYRSLFNSMSQGFCVVELMRDADGAAFDYRILEINPAGVAIYGMGEVAGKTIRELAPSMDLQWIQTCQQVAVSGQPTRFENRSQVTGRWYEGDISRVGGDGSAKVALLFSDVTPRKENDARLRRLAADLSAEDRRKTEFLAVLAHELRNPLAPLRSGLDILKLGASSSPLVDKIRDMMDRQVSHMVRLVDDLLDVARINGGKIELKKETTTLQAIVNTAVEATAPLMEAAGHRLEVVLPARPLALTVDAARLVQVLGNLLNNAAKYTPAGGHVRLAAGQEGEGAAAEVVISVADNGVGIPEASLPFIFDMFNQVGRNKDLSHGGLGIGLSLVKRLLALHGGRITVTNVGVGGAGTAGTTFVVGLPAGAAEAMAPAVAAAALLAASATLRILLVDDNVDGAETLASLLALKGHEVRVAHDGLAALEVVADWVPQVGLIDIGMPKMNGYELAQALRALPALREMTLVALTGWGAEGDRRQSSAAGFAEHLTKPVDFGALDEVLRRAA